MLSLEMIGVDENDNKPEPEDASHDNVDDFNDATCEVCLQMLRMQFILLRTMMRWKSYLKTIETNKANSKDVTQDKVEIY